MSNEDLGGLHRTYGNGTTSLLRHSPCLTFFLAWVAGVERFIAAAAYDSASRYDGRHVVRVRAAWTGHGHGVVHCDTPVGIRCLITSFASQLHRLHSRLISSSNVTLL